MPFTWKASRRSEVASRTAAVGRLARAGLPCAGLAAAACLLTPTPGRSQAQLSAADFRLLPVRVHLLRAVATSELNCRLKDADVRRVLGKVNGIWKQAGVQFYAESILSENAAGVELYDALGENRTLEHLLVTRPRASRSDQLFHLYYVGQMGPNGVCFNESFQLIFVKDSASLDPVPGGIDEPLPRVSAHEIGHALGLPHRQARTNLMASGTTGTSLNEAEIGKVRETAETLKWRLTPAEALKQAESLPSDKKAAAQDLYRTLAGLPGGDEAAAARKHLTAESPK